MRQLVLAVVSYPAQLERLFEETALALGRLVHDGFVVERCQQAAELVPLVRTWKLRGFRIERLDLYGHGAGGQFKLGDELLFDSDGTGYGLAKRLGPKLAANAAVRLLGCRTAEEQVNFATGRLHRSGARMLRELARALGRQREVWGSTAYLGLQDFTSEARLSGKLVRSSL